MIAGFMGRRLPMSTCGGQFFRRGGHCISSRGAPWLGAFTLEINTARWRAQTNG
jgi:hypothetical protein